MDSDISIGLDVGSVSLKMAVLVRQREKDSSGMTPFASGRFREVRPDPVEGWTLWISDYLRHQGEPFTKTVELLDTFSTDSLENTGLCVTGSGGKIFQDVWSCIYVNEFRAISEAMGRCYPRVKTVFEIGGNSSKYLLVGGHAEGQSQILDYETNGECAAGTGAFFDQQADRLKIEVDEMAGLLTRAKRTASIAGRCSVFAKSDMIHAQQRGYRPEEVLKGLCEAIVRNFKGSITKGKEIRPPIALIGGVAANPGIVQAFKNQFAWSDGQLIVPDLYVWMGAVGAALLGIEQFDRGSGVTLDTGLSKKPGIYPTIQPLSLEKVRLLRDRIKHSEPGGHTTVDAFLGIDVGSVSTNLALIDNQGGLIHGIYLMTDGRPIEVVTQALREMELVVGTAVRIQGVGTTGSGRELIGFLTGADVVKDEITAHKTGAVEVSEQVLDGRVDTIFEIGGQDAKFISIQDGTVIDFSLNEACAAGTGSFLEEQANQIGIDIRDEFAKLALRSKHPLRLGERCTVFMEKELVPYLQQGVPKEDIVAGLAVSVVQNYLNRVVKKRTIGDVIFFQGGTAYNDAVAAAFATYLDKEIIVPPHNGIMGAIGAALLARNRCSGKDQTLFRGWDLNRVSWSEREFVCEACSNHCSIQEFVVEGEKCYWGDKCSERFRKRSKSRIKPVAEDLFRLREDLLGFGDHQERKATSRRQKTVGIPRALLFYDRYPFWKTFFESMDFHVVVSNPTKRDIIHAGVEASVADPCFPIQVAHGHLLDLGQHDVDIVFIPNVVNEEDPTHSVSSFICPWSQTLPLVIKHTPAFHDLRSKVFCPSIRFRQGKDFVRRTLLQELDRFGLQSRGCRRALDRAYAAQDEYRKKMCEAGQGVLPKLYESGRPAIVLLGRPYNVYDAGLNLNIPAKLRGLYGVDVIPMDFLPVDGVDIHSVHPHMFWNYGRRVLQAARIARDFPQHHLIVISNFKCGPDSYIRHYIEEAAQKPYLFLQLDSHANDAGVMTRIEAFLESKGMIH